MLYLSNKSILRCRVQGLYNFVHLDRNGNAAGGEIQGLDPVHRFKSMVPGTRDTVFRFIPEQAKSSRLKKAYIFESSIDLMSFYSMFRKEIDLKTSEFISLAGLKTSVPKRLQAEGIEIISCVDNDAAGQKFELQNGFKRSEFVREHLDASGLKDWNDLLRYPDAKPEQAHAAPVRKRFFGRSMTH